MHCKYVGLRQPDGTCLVTRVDTTRVARLIVLSLPIGHGHRLITFPLADLYPEAAPFKWGIKSTESLSLARTLLRDMLNDCPPEEYIAERYLCHVVRYLPYDGWEIDWSDVWQWWVENRRDESAAMLRQIDGWRADLDG